jgi:benzoylformate decarboxylase
VLIYGAAIARGSGWNEAVALAEDLNAPVWAAPASERTPFPENHPLYAGALPFAIGPLSEKLQGHDVALVVGTPVFRYYPYVPGPYLPDRQRLLHISEDAAETGRAPMGDSLVGDAVLALVGLKDLLSDHKSSNGRSRQRLENQVAAPAVMNGSQHGGAPAAAQVLAALSDVRPAHAVLVQECPSNVADLQHAWPIIEPDTYYTFASGALGWGLPASVGVALAERDSGRNRPVIAIVGDGASQYSIQAMWTAAQLRLPLLIVIMCNEQYAILKSFAMLEHTPGVPGLELPDMDFVAIAQRLRLQRDARGGSRCDQGCGREGVGEGPSDSARGAHLEGDRSADLSLQTASCGNRMQEFDVHLTGSRTVNSGISVERRKAA